MNNPLSVFSFLFLFLALGGGSRAQKAPGFKKLVFPILQGDTVPYRLFIPAGDKETRFPLVIFLHGSGERGKDNERQLMNGVKNFATPKVQKNHPCFILVPQCPQGQRWVNVDYSQKVIHQPDTISVILGNVMLLVRDLISRYPIDTTRIYITGLSMGGFGTWDLITRYPSFFSAAVPICGGGDVKKAKLVKNVPVWAFHGAKDEVVRPELSRAMVKAIEKAGGKPKYTEYPDLKHNCWDATYKDPRVFRWLFSQSRLAE